MRRHPNFLYPADCLFKFKMLRGEWGLLSYYHKNLLFGGGIVFSVLVMIVMLLASLVEISNFINEKKSDFHQRKIQMAVEIETRQMAMLRGVIAAEALWEHKQPPRFRPKLWEEGADNGRKVVPVVIQRESLQNSFRDDSYIDILGELSYLANSSFLHYGNALSSYVFSTDGKFIGVLLPAASRNAYDKTMHDSILRQVSSMQQAGEQWGRVLAPHRLAWLEPKTSLLNGEKSFQLIASAFKKGKPFLSVVSELPTSYLERLLEQEKDGGEFFILNELGRVILGDPEGSQKDPARYSFLESKKNNGGKLNSYFMSKYGGFYMDGAFHFLSRISRSEMSVLHVFYWSDIFNSIKYKLLIYWISALFWIVLLWLFFIYFNSNVFQPIYRKSKTVFDSENLSRTIIAMAPYGLGLFSLSEKKVLLENGLMRKYRDALVISDHGKDKSLTDLFYGIYKDLQHSGQEADGQRLRSEAIVDVNGVMAELSVTSAVTNYQGKKVLLCGFSDITVHKQIERSLEEARASAENANQAKSSFLAAMSHEIRTPLNAILGNLEILGRSHLSEFQHIRLKTIHSSSSLLLSLLNDILDFSKIESGEMHVEKGVFDLRKAVLQVVDIYKPLALDKGVKFLLNFDECLGEAYSGDSVRIKQILNNLLSNAVKFTERGLIRVDVQAVQGKLIIEVADTGIGIHHSQQEFIFDSFKQANAEVSRNFGGTGLGLTLSKKMAQLMGGDISFSSELNKGSVFCLTLPLENSQKPESAMSKEDGAEDLVDMEQKIRVLVVDDHPANRMLLVDQMEILGCLVDSAENGEMALKKMKEKDFNLVFTDLQMRGVDGYELSSIIKHQEKAIPVIAITSHTSEEDRKKCRNHGIAEILFKPASLQDISRTIIRNAGEKAHQVSAKPVHEPQQGQDFKKVLMSAAYHSVQQMNMALRDNDPDSIFREIHSMKGSFAIANLPEIVGFLNMLQDCVRSGDMEGFGRKLIELEMLLKEL